MLSLFWRNCQNVKKIVILCQISQICFLIFWNEKPWIFFVVYDKCLIYYMETNFWSSTVWNIFWITHVHIRTKLTELRKKLLTLPTYKKNPEEYEIISVHEINEVTKRWEFQNNVKIYLLSSVMKPKTGSYAMRDCLKQPEMLYLLLFNADVCYLLRNPLSIKSIYVNCHL